MRARVLYVQCVAVRIWEVKNVLDVNRTGSMKPQKRLMERSPCYTEDPVPLTFN